jgi:hypothetical protein
MHIQEHHLMIMALARHRRLETRAAVAAARRAPTRDAGVDRDPRERARRVLSPWPWAS